MSVGQPHQHTHPKTQRAQTQLESRACPRGGGGEVVNRSNPSPPERAHARLLESLAHTVERAPHIHAHIKSDKIHHYYEHIKYIKIKYNLLSSCCWLARNSVVSLALRTRDRCLSFRRIARLLPDFARSAISRALHPFHPAGACCTFPATPLSLSPPHTFASVSRCYSPFLWLYGVPSSSSSIAYCVSDLIFSLAPLSSPPTPGSWSHPFPTHTVKSQKNAHTPTFVVGFSSRDNSFL